MANEKKNLEAVQNAEEMKIPAEVTKATEEMQTVEKVEGKDVLTPFEIIRESFLMNEGEKDEKKCFDYVLKAEFPYAGGMKTYNIHFIPSDVAGYDVLDLIYNVSGEGAEFIIRPWTIKADKKRGIEAGEGYTYVIRAKGLPELELKVKPAKDSDKALLRAVLALAGFKV